MYKKDYDFVFYHKKNFNSNDIIPSAYKTKLIPESISIEQEPGWLVSLFNYNEYIIIADGYQFISTYQRQIKEKGFKLIYIDDLAKEHMLQTWLLIILRTPKKTTLVRSDTPS